MFNFRINPMNSFEFKKWWSSKKSSTALFEKWVELIENNKFSEIIRKVKSGNLNPNNEIINGLTPLHIACIQGNVEAVKLFIEFGVDIDVKSKVGRTPLHEAMFYGNSECVRELLQSGAVLCFQEKLLDEQC